ncbi:hypothetical protein F2P56_000651 [Juglans regia]|uniref:Uncharacterized protein n=1 Tax=Juglans regia TaxID=51240 RepID=A0A833Y743_JUGRE|nr:hypothetical protein F2P56_000651 [Juglans regia]
MVPVLPCISVPDMGPILSLGSTTSSSMTSTMLPSWMNMIYSRTTSSSTTSPTLSPSVRLSLSPTKPAMELDSNPILLSPDRQMTRLIQCYKEVEEGRHSWVQYKKEVEQGGAAAGVREGKKNERKDGEDRGKDKVTERGRDGICG